MGDAGTTVVVDSSVAFKWFVEERERQVAAAWSLLTAHLEGPTSLASVTHMRLEVLNALLRRGLASRDLVRASDALDGFRIEWREIDGALARAAARLASEHALTPYDAAFAALALELDAELVTADARLARSGACRTRLLGG